MADVLCFYNVPQLLSIVVVNDVLLLIRTKLLCLFWI